MPRISPWDAVAEHEPRRRLTDLFDRYGDAIYAFAVHRVPREDAEDVVSEVFLVAWRRLADVRRGEERAWLYGVARKVILTRARYNADRTALLHRLQGVQDPGSADLADDVVQRRHVLTALQDLPTRDREVLLLAYWYDLERHEAARVAGCNVATFTVRLYRARQRFARALRASGTTQVFPLLPAAQLRPEGTSS